MRVLSRIGGGSVPGPTRRGEAAAGLPGPRVARAEPVLAPGDLAPPEVRAEESAAAGAPALSPAQVRLAIDRLLGRAPASEEESAMLEVVRRYAALMASIPAGIAALILG